MRFFSRQPEAVPPKLESFSIDLLADHLKAQDRALISNLKRDEHIESTPGAIQIRSVAEHFVSGVNVARYGAVTAELSYSARSRELSANVTLELAPHLQEACAGATKLSFPMAVDTDFFTARHQGSALYAAVSQEVHSQLHRRLSELQNLNFLRMALNQTFPGAEFSIAQSAQGDFQLQSLVSPTLTRADSDIQVRVPGPILQGFRPKADSSMRWLHTGGSVEAPEILGPSGKFSIPHDALSLAQLGNDVYQNLGRLTGRPDLEDGTLARLKSEIDAAAAEADRRTQAAFKDRLSAAYLLEGAETRPFAGGAHPRFSLDPASGTFSDWPRGLPAVIFPGTQDHSRSYGTDAQQQVAVRAREPGALEVRFITEVPHKIPAGSPRPDPTQPWPADRYEGTRVFRAEVATANTADVRKEFERWLESEETRFAVACSVLLGLKERLPSSRFSVTLASEPSQQGMPVVLITDTTFSKQVSLPIPQNPFFEASLSVEAGSAPDYLTPRSVGMSEGIWSNPQLQTKFFGELLRSLQQGFHNLGVSDAYGFESPFTRARPASAVPVAG